MLLYQKHVAGSKGHPKVLMPHRPFQWPFFPTTRTLSCFSVQENGPTKTHACRSCVAPKRTAQPDATTTHTHSPDRRRSCRRGRTRTTTAAAAKMARSSLLLMLYVLPFFISAQVFFSHFLCSRFCAGVVCLLFVENSFLHNYCGEYRHSLIPVGCKCLACAPLRRENFFFAN